MAHETRSARIGAELALAAEPGHDHGGDKTERDVQHDGGHHVANASARAVVFQNHFVHKVADHA